MMIVYAINKYLHLMNHKYVHMVNKLNQNAKIMKELMKITNIAYVEMTKYKEMKYVVIMKYIHQILHVIIIQI